MPGLDRMVPFPKTDNTGGESLSEGNMTVGLVTLPRDREQEKKGRGEGTEVEGSKPGDLGVLTPPWIIDAGDNNCPFSLAWYRLLLQPCVWRPGPHVTDLLHFTCLG